MSRRHRAFRRLLAPLLVALALFAPAAVRAEIKRYAFLVGSSRGAAHEPVLRYAESDVNAVAETLVQIGSFPSERVVRLVGAKADRVRAALVDLNLAIQQDLRAGGEAVLFVYYSGHADAQNLHLGGTELPTEELSKLVRLSQAKLKILLVDACRSGSLTRVKGGQPVAPFQIGVQDLLRNEGYAIITSSTAGEDSQESDALGSSIFTHHFLAALRGPADANRDRLVTLGEAYGYAAEQTLKTSITTIAGSQHATFDYDLRGRADPVLSDLRSRGERAELVLAAPGEYLVMMADTGALVLEAGARAARTPLQLSPGRYSVRMRTRTSVYQTELALAPGESRTLAPEGMRALPLAMVVRKGETDASLASGPSVGGMMHGALADSFSPMLGVQLAWAFELPRLTLMPRLGWSTGRALDLGAGVRSHSFRELSVELAGLYVFDVGRLALAPLVSVGAGFFQQRVERESGCSADDPCVANPRGLITTLGGWASWPLGRGFTLEGSVELANFYLRKQESTAVKEPGAPRTGTLTYRTGLGLGYRY
jgi:hypothetical protein